MTALGSRNKQMMADSLEELAHRLAFRLAEGFTERVVFREFFPRGLTALDTLDEKTLGREPKLSNLAARQEVRNLVESLKLPIDERGRKRAAARFEWAGRSEAPLELHDILAG